MTRVLFWAALMDQEEEAQVVIPDLEDEDVLGSCLDATLNNGFYSPNGPPADPRSPISRMPSTFRHRSPHRLPLPYPFPQTSALLENCFISVQDLSLQMNLRQFLPRAHCALALRSPMHSKV